MKPHREFGTVQDLPEHSTRFNASRIRGRPGQFPRGDEHERYQPGRRFERVGRELAKLRPVPMMESRIDAGLAQLREDMAKPATEAAKRETRLLLPFAAMIGLDIAIPGFIL